MSEDKGLTERGRVFQITGPVYRKVKESLPRGPSANPMNCTRDNVEADGSYFVLNPAADVASGDRKVKE